MSNKFLRLLRKFSSFKKDRFGNYPKSFSSLLAVKLSSLEKLLGYSIKNPHYYIKALTHRSFDEFEELNLRSNERLEYLGDSVLSVIVAEYLFTHYQNEEEGFLTKTRAKMVNKQALTKVAENIHLLDYMLVNNSFLSDTNGVDTIISDAVEALIGAIYLDSGLTQAKRFVGKFIIGPFLQQDGIMEDNNFKSRLLEYTQANKMENPSYKVIKEEGPNHAKTFTIEAILDGRIMGTGVGKNKKEAEQNAAKDAFKRIVEEEKQAGYTI